MVKRGRQLRALRVVRVVAADGSARGDLREQRDDEYRCGEHEADGATAAVDTMLNAQSDGTATGG